MAVLMAADLWPCWRCGNPGVRNLGTQGWCGAHLAQLYGSFDPAVFRLNGIGAQSGPLAPEHGPLYAVLTCVACGAGWVGIPGERCGWCARARQRLQRWAAEAALEPPDVDVQDELYEQRMRGWAKRLATAAKAGIVTETEARRVWNRTVRRADAA